MPVEKWFFCRLVQNLEYNLVKMRIEPSTYNIPMRRLAFCLLLTGELVTLGPPLFSRLFSLFLNSSAAFCSSWVSAQFPRRIDSE